MKKTKEICFKQRARPDNFPTKTTEEKLSKGSLKNIKSSETDNHLCTAISNLKSNDASCVSYKTKFQSTINIDDSKLKGGSADNFHDKYKIFSKLFENEDCIVFFFCEDKNSRGGMWR